jgi:hypothetical protein
MEFNPAEFWSEHADSGQRKMEVAQKELLRLMPELFEDVVFLYTNEADSAA